MNTFEETLLGELKQVVAERAAEPEPRRAWRPRLVLAGMTTAAMAAGLIVGVPILTGNQAPPAWAVTSEQDGWVKVVITQPRDADGLEHRLEQLGIGADVTFTPSDQICRAPRYSEAPASERLLQLSPLDGGVGKFVIRIRPALFEPNQTLVIEMSEGINHQDNGQSTWRSYVLAVAEGTVAPCALVPAVPDTN